MDRKETDITSIIQNCLKHDEAAQYELYKRYSKAMYSTALRILGNIEDAEDALQEAFIKAFKNLKKFDCNASFGSWMKRITINECLNRLRKKKLKWLELDFDIPDYNEEEELKITPEVLYETIEKLPSGCKTVLLLKAFEGYKHEEIAAKLNISLSTSKSQYVRGKKLLSYSLKRLVQL